MTRTAATPGRRRRTSRPQLAGREAFEHALDQLAQLPPKPDRQNIAAEYLPRFVAKLRELQYHQDDIVQTIVGMNLGVTERQIRAADSAWTKVHGKARGPSGSGVDGGAPSSTAPGADAHGGTPGAAPGASGPHAGLTGAGALRR